MLYSKETIKMVDGIPRRNRQDLLEPSELAIKKAIEEVEKLGADPRLTDIVIKLVNANVFLADYIESKQE